MTGDEIRLKFLEYFKKYDHQIVRSSSLIPQDDPTLLFTNAGMVQFKRVFLGEEKRSYVRATTSQKCVRAGGKHNDLENVGHTARHHTFFEMLGNFSFGDYFKEKAIEFAWELLTNGYKLPEYKLWVSIYLDDDEAYKIWRENIGIPDDKIVRFGEKDNFWSMGDTGPCGPCSEILIDRGEKYGCKKSDCKVGCECDRYLEIWNLVFMQYNKDLSGNLTRLFYPSIDTGMGLERIISIIQNTATNYEIDLLMPIIKKVEELSDKEYGKSYDIDVAMKVIADHTRACAFLIGDGVLPSNEGRGYVLRRIMRRAIRYGRNIGLTKAFLDKTAYVVFEIMKSAYPELNEAKAFITNVINNEELRFSETLDNGLKLLNDTLSDMQERGIKVVPGEAIFKLYDTYGFPVDIIKDIVRDKNLQLDIDGYNKAMNEQRLKSRSTSAFINTGDAFKNLSAKGLKSIFLGYNNIEIDSEILVLAQNGVEIEEALEESEIEIVTKYTPFYAESGGQVGDIGKIKTNNCEIEILNTIKDPTGLIIHRAKVISGKIQKNDVVKLMVDKERRNAIAQNHTATHILHSALRQVLGEHAKQSGSLVDAQRLRFDFTHFTQVDLETLNNIETIVNKHIRSNVSVSIEEMDSKEAFKTGAVALFEEKYGDVVRVITLSSFSKELCGGIHTQYTGNIGFFKIISESSVAAGIRRIEALTGEAASLYVQKSQKILSDISNILKDKPENFLNKIDKMLSYQKTLEKELENIKTKMAEVKAGILEDDIKDIDGVKVLVKKVLVEKPAALRELADKYKDKIKSGIVVLGSIAESKAFFIVSVSKDIAGRFHAGNIVKQLAEIVGGSGGGRPDMAQAGGTKIDKLDEALEKAHTFIT